MAKKKIMEIELRRNGNIYLKMKVDPAIEDLFRNDDVRTSIRWKQTDGTALEFYRVESGSDIAREFDYDDFGQPFVNNQKVNYAILRTKGLSNGIEFSIPESAYSQETLELAVRSLRKKVAELYKKYCNKVKIWGTLEIEEVM